MAAGLAVGLTTSVLFPPADPSAFPTGADATNDTLVPSDVTGGQAPMVAQEPRPGETRAAASEPLVIAGASKDGVAEPAPAETPTPADAESRAMDPPTAEPTETPPAPTSTPVPPTPTPVPPTPTPVPPTATPEPRQNFYVPSVPGGPMTGLEQRLFDGLNTQRAAGGLGTYAFDSTASRIARTRSQQMVDQGYFGHVDPHGYTMYVELLGHFGVSYARAGENLAVNNYGNHESPERAVTSLMNSPSHRANIMSGSFSRVGVGVATHPDGRKFYTIIFLA